MSHPYQRPMSPAPGLDVFSKNIVLSKNRIAIHYYDAGRPNAGAIVLVHGLGDEADTWRHVIPELSQHHRVLAIDLPGFGRSPKPERACTIAFYCGILLNFLNDLNIEKAIFIGNSLGGMIVQQFSLIYPTRVAKLVLVDGSLVSTGRKITLSLLIFMIPGLGEWSYNRLRKNPDAAFATLKSYYASLDGLPAADREFLYQRVNERVWSNTQRDAFLSVLRSMVKEKIKPGEEALPASTIPTLVVWGEKDAIQPLENGKAAAARQPTTSLVVIPDAGHLPHQEKPQAFLAAVDSFLSA
ncbi:MAG TPA: alpha/beta hydrolase [Anaerolineaceae bacterium]